MPFFVDTSALFKRYQVEKGTERVSELLENAHGEAFISSLTIIEVISNLKRLYEIDRITTEEQFLQQRLFFYHDIEELILKQYMKPVDAVQLAVALNNFAEKPTFVSSDQKLCAIAQQEGLSVLNPEA